MKGLNFKNFDYALIDSAKSGYREVLVTYSVDGKTARQCIFIKEVSGKDKNYYLNEAKRQINGEMANGTLAKNTKKQLKRVSSKGILKPVLISLGIILGIGAVGTGGYFTYQAINGEGTGQGGGGGGGSYQPGDPAPVNFDEESLPEGIKLDIANATVGSDYSTDINLREVAASNGVEYSMPKKLDKVTYKKDTLDVEISDYTYTWVSKTTAKLEIKKDYVLGPISIKLTLQQAEVEDVTLTLAQATTNCKITYNGTQFDAEHPITIRSGKNIDLVCETLDTNYSITNDSFEFTPALPSETGWTWEGKANTLHIYNLAAKRGASTSYALTVSPIKDPIEISVTRYDESGYGSGLHLFYGDNEIPDSPITKTPILVNGDKCAFRVELDKGYTITDEGFTIYRSAGGKEPLSPDNYSYAEGMLTIEDVPFDEIGGLRIVTNVYYTTYYRSTIVSLAEHCKVMYRGNTYGFGDEILVYPDGDYLVQFDIVTDDGYVMCCYDAAVNDFFGYTTLGIDEFYQTDDNHYSVVVNYEDTSPLDMFYALFRTSKLPDTYILLDKDSVGRGAFYDESIERSLPFYDLEKNGYIGYSDIEDIGFYLWDFDDTVYSIASVDGLMPDGMYYNYDSYDVSYISIYFSNHFIEKGDYITIKLIEPADSDPILSLDSDASDHIIFTDSLGEGENTETTLITDKEGYCNFYFKFKNFGSDINRYCIYINGFPYDIDFEVYDGYCRGRFYVGTDWPGYNLELHVNAPVEISLGKINEDKCTLIDPSTGDKLSSYGEPIGYAPNRNGDIVFDCYVEKELTDSYLLTKNSFTIAGDVGDHEYDINSGYLIVHNVTGNFSISIEPGSRYVEILTSTDAPTDLINITYYVGKEGMPITNKGSTISYDASAILSNALYFEIKLTDAAQGRYVIDTECYIDYTTKDSKEEKRLYGLYVSGGASIFNPDDISNITSMKIHVNYKPIEFKSTGGVSLSWNDKEQKINRVNICGTDLRSPGPILPEQSSTSILDIYVRATDKFTVTSGVLTAKVEDIGNRNGMYNYHIIISGVTATTKATIILN